MNATSTSTGSLMQQQMQGSSTSPDSIVVIPEQVSYLMPQIGINGGMSSSRNQVVPLAAPSGGISMMSYGDGSMQPTLSDNPSMQPAVMAYSYLNETIPYHQQDYAVGNMDQLADNMEYQQNGTEFTTLTVTHSVNLKPPKRTMSAYACYSRKVFNSVREKMGANLKQCDIFREIANMWRKLPMEEKQPYIDEANEDKKRKKIDEQNYNRVRRDVEKSLVSGGSLPFSTANGPTRFISSVCEEKDPTQLAVFLLELTGNNLKNTTEMLQECARVLANEGESILFSKQETSQEALHEATLEAFQYTPSSHQFQCPECKKCFNWKSNLNVHMRIHDKLRQREFKCTYQGCGKAFFDNQHLKQHMQTHNRHRDIYCCQYPGCNKKYSTSGGLTLHIKSHHQIDKRYKCDVPGCDRAFVRQTDLRIHKLRVHSDTKPYVCNFPHCDKSYVSASELNRHKQSHKYLAEQIEANVGV